MLKLTVSRAAIVALVAAAFLACPLVASAGALQQTGQQTPPTTQTPPSGQQTQPGQPGQPGQASDSQRQAALEQLTAARQDLADITKLPAATHIEGQARNDLNQLISNFNSLITSSGAEWRQAYDKVQANLSALLGPESSEQTGQSAIGTTGTAGGTTGGTTSGTTGATTGGTSGGTGTSASSLDPSITAKLNDMRQRINQFGQIVGVKPGQSAVASEPNAAGGQTTTGTAGRVNEQALHNIDQIGAIISRALSQGTPDQASVTLSRQDLQQIQQYLDSLRQAIGQQPNR